MKKIIVNEKEITTNLGENGAYTLVKGDDLPNYRMQLPNFRESDEEFLKRLVSYGYTRIRFARVTTMVRGFHKTIAYCR